MVTGRDRLAFRLGTELAQSAPLISPGHCVCVHLHDEDACAHTHTQLLGQSLTGSHGSHIGLLSTHCHTHSPISFIHSPFGSHAHAGMHILSMLMLLPGASVHTLLCMYKHIFIHCCVCTNKRV